MFINILGRAFEIETTRQKLSMPYQVIKVRGQNVFSNMILFSNGKKDSSSQQPSGPLKIDVVAPIP